MIHVSNEIGMGPLRGDIYCTASDSHLLFDPNSDVKGYKAELITVGLLPPTIIYYQLFTLILNIYGKSTKKKKNLLRIIPGVNYGDSYSTFITIAVNKTLRTFLCSLSIIDTSNS